MSSLSFHYQSPLTRTRKFLLFQIWSYNNVLNHTLLSYILFPMYVGLVIRWWMLIFFFFSCEVGLWVKKFGRDNKVAAVAEILMHSRGSDTPEFILLMNWPEAIISSRIKEYIVPIYDSLWVSMTASTRPWNDYAHKKATSRQFLEIICRRLNLESFQVTRKSKKNTCLSESLKKRDRNL